MEEKLKIKILISLRVLNRHQTLVFSPLDRGTDDFWLFKSGRLIPVGHGHRPEDRSINHPWAD